MVSRIAKIIPVILVLILVLAITITGCKTEESAEEVVVETKKEAPAETAEEVTEEEETETEEPETVTITDSSGREVTIEKPVERIIITSGSMEAISITNLWDKVVGRGNIISEMLPPSIENIPVVGQPSSPYALNYEKVFELHPDILLTAYVPMPGFDEMLKNLEPEIPVIALNLYDSDTIIENFRKLGSILDQEEEVEKFIAFYNEIEADILKATSNIPEEDRPRIFYKIEWGDVTNLMTYSNDRPGFAYRCKTTGCVNVAADLQAEGGWVQDVDPEWLTEQDPDVILVCDYNEDNFGLNKDDPSAAEIRRNEIMELDVFSRGSAAKNEDVYLESGEFEGRPGYIIGMAYEAKWLHPDLFQDFNPQAILQEYLTKFMRIDHDLDKHGVFVYPEP